MNKRSLGVFMWVAFGLVVLYLLFRSRSAQAMAPATTGTAKLKNSSDDWANLAGTVVSGGFGLLDALIKTKTASSNVDSSPDFSYGGFSGSGGSISVSPAVASPSPDFSFGDFSGAGSSATIGYSPDFSGGAFSGSGATGSW